MVLFNVFKNLCSLMQALEAFGLIDNQGIIQLKYPLSVKNKKAKLIILIDEDDDDFTNLEWHKAITNNPAFDFLYDDAENIYSLTDGIVFR
jgi:hypothetical protein